MKSPRGRFVNTRKTHVLYGQKYEDKKRRKYEEREKNIKTNDFNRLKHKIFHASSPFAEDLTVLPDRFDTVRQTR